MRGWRGLLTAGAALTLLAGLRPAVQERQERAGLVIQGADTQGMASDVAVPTLALGAFRGLVVDYLWIRTISLREQGRTYEARVLAEQIGRLQPRLPAVWDYLGSHLAYDLTATAADAETRWAWIQNGLDLVREQGLAKNPQSARLCYTLSRIYQDKVNTSMDEFHADFKREHVLKMRRAGACLLKIGFTIQELASAPGLSALATQDEEARDVLVRYARAKGYQSLADLQPSLICQDYHLYVFERREPLEAGEAQSLVDEVNLLRSLHQTAAGRRVLASCAAAALREIGFEPEYMARISAEWGPLDWESSFSAPIYWSVRGLWMAEAKDDVVMKSRCRRSALQALKNALRSGVSKIEVDPLAGGKLIGLTLPNLELIPYLERLYREGTEMATADIVRLSKQETFDPQDMRAARSFETNQHEARKDFLMEAVILLSEYGRDTEGQLLLERAARDYPEEPNFKIPYQEYLLTMMANRVTDAGAMDTVDSVTQALLGLWRRHLIYLAYGEDERAKTYYALAVARQSRWQRYVEFSLEEDPSAAKRLHVDFKRVYFQALTEAVNQIDHPGFKARLAQRLGYEPDRFLRRREPGQPGPGTPLPGGPR